MKRLYCALGLLLCAQAAFTRTAQGQEYRRRTNLLCEIQKQKFDSILPRAMRENHIDMWLIAMREGAPDPTTAGMGRGYQPLYGYYIFTDKGAGRIERVALRIVGAQLERCGAFDSVGERTELKVFVEQRNPKVIGINTATEIGVADGLSHTMYEKLVADLGPDLVKRLVSAEKLNSDYRSLMALLEIEAYKQAGEYSRTIADRAFSNEVIVPGRTTLRDVSDWMADRLLEKGLGHSFDIPNVLVTGPTRKASSSETIIQPGDVLSVDWGVVYLDKWTDMKRTAYVLKPGETAPPPGIQHAWDQAMAVRKMIVDEIKPGGIASEMLAHLYDRVEAMPGYGTVRTNTPDSSPFTKVIIGCHAVADFGHGSGASIITYPLRGSYTLKPTQGISIEFFASTPVPEWNGTRLNIALEDDALITQTGVEFIYPPAQRILLIK